MYETLPIKGGLETIPFKALFRAEVMTLPKSYFDIQCHEIHEEVSKFAKIIQDVVQKYIPSKSKRRVQFRTELWLSRVRSFKGHPFCTKS